MCYLYMRWLGADVGDRYTGVRVTRGYELPTVGTKLWFSGRVGNTLKSAIFTASAS